MSASTSWLVVLAVCVVAVPLTYLIAWLIREGRDRLRRWVRGRGRR